MPRGYSCIGDPDPRNHELTEYPELPPPYNTEALFCKRCGAAFSRRGRPLALSAPGAIP